MKKIQRIGKVKFVVTRALNILLCLKVYLCLSLSLSLKIKSLSLVTFYSHFQCSRSFSHSLIWFNEHSLFQHSMTSFFSHIIIWLNEFIEITSYVQNRVSRAGNTAHLPAEGLPQALQAGQLLQKDQADPWQGRGCTIHIHIQYTYIKYGFITIGVNGKS